MQQAFDIQMLEIHMPENASKYEQSHPYFPPQARPGARSLTPPTHSIIVSDLCRAYQSRGKQRLSHVAGISLRGLKGAKSEGARFLSDPR
jgi:hypothetical protein